ncbi:DNA-binding response regulator [Pseudoalteromonas ruthenica]|uniref:DNA-binding response regulator n=1 Tax=Pseudoalteromonas ruthenica TaxID=151081 RepID=A0A5S3Z2J7_9GAMM|nr:MULTISPECIES: response regulator transcription factor [Pseudoalteromonas]MCG7569903.1 response regulator transcription factor [Pseudoalteromonas sp. CNC9-20]TMP86438.1 DNA-binding response regulator [Pseudoalteromonas ruthenica]
MIRVVVIEDQALVRNAIVALLNLDPFIKVVGEASDGQSALTLLTEVRADLLLSDIEMPNMSGLELAEQVTHEGIQIVIMTTFSKSGYIRRALDAGVRGFILKEASSDYLIDALKKVHQGQKVIDPELALLALEDNNPLSRKESAALKLTEEGLKTSDIAAQLYLSEGTVRNYLSEAISKLNASNRSDAARIARQKGWL